MATTTSTTSVAISIMPITCTSTSIMLITVITTSVAIFISVLTSTYSVATFISGITSTYSVSTSMPITCAFSLAILAVSSRFWVPRLQGKGIAKEIKHQEVEPSNIMPDAS